MRAELGPRAADWPLVVADSARPGVAGGDGGRRARGGDHGRPLPARRAAAGRRLHRGGHRLRRPDRRDPVRARVHGAPRPRRRGGRRGSSTPAASTRSPPTSARCCSHETVRADGAGELGETTLVVTAMKGGAQRRHARLAQGPGRRHEGERRRPQGGRRPLRPEPGPRRRPRRPRRARPARRGARRGARPVDRPVRDGVLQHAHRAPLATRSRTGPTGAASATARSRGSAPASSRRSSAPGWRAASWPSPAASPSSRRGCCSTACCPTPARARARSRARPACSGWRSTPRPRRARATSPGSPPRATPATRRPR